MKMAPKKTGSADAAYIAKALAAAPKSIAKDAGVVRFDKDGKMSDASRKQERLHLHGD